ncbi:hypothetical protein TSUD_61810 [Trifolium subterraneum]|uniref:TF-B3 domain-containing protein n=1 Tax=Trifolium subterraneum TaxID=3900 RepID=A0A2Z6NNX2_TRISU|nr:hypothetical protein TSUD_61810 [Trifolium subterraneum]
MANDLDIKSSIETFLNERRQGIPLDNKRDMQGIEWDLQGYAMMTRTCYLEFDPLRISYLDTNMQPISLLTKTCYMEFDPMSSRAKLPVCFARDVGPFLGSYVILQYPKRNHIQIAIQKKNNKYYFTSGWSRLRDFYDIGLGGWVTLLYISPLLFHVKVRKITGIEATYPEKNPPFRLMLLNGSGGSSSNGPIPYFAAPRTFYHSLEKTLTSSDIESGILKLSWHGFCEHALPSEETQLTLVDWIGYTWRCQLKFENHPHKTCNISGQWRNIYKAHHFAEGVTIKFGVIGPVNNNVIHLKISPFLGVRTTIIAPTKASGHKTFYQTQHYFML